MVNITRKKFSIALSLGLGTLTVAHAHTAEPDASNSAGHSHAGEHAPEIFTKVMIDQLEIRDGEGGNLLVLEGQAWIGSDLNKLWLKADIESLGGDVEEFELQALYSRAVASYWDLQLGVRQDIRPNSGRNWGVLGIQGLAPYFFETEAALFISGSGDTAIRLSTEYELLLTQQWVLSPEIGANIYGQNDRGTGTGSELSDVHAGLRLRYEIRREFAPYIGINWSKRFGNTADFATDAGEEVRDTQWVAGFRIWF